MATGSVRAIGTIYSAVHDGSVTVETGTDSNLGISLSLPPGGYAVTVTCSACKSGTGSGNAYPYIRLSVGNTELWPGTTQCSSSSSTDQKPMTSTFYIKLTEQATVMPIARTSVNPATFIDRQGIYAVRIA